MNFEIYLNNRFWRPLQFGIQHLPQKFTLASLGAKPSLSADKPTQSLRYQVTSRGQLLRTATIQRLNAQQYQSIQSCKRTLIDPEASISQGNPDLSPSITLFTDRSQLDLIITGIEWLMNLLIFRETMNLILETIHCILELRIIVAFLKLSTTLLSNYPGVISFKSNEGVTYDSSFYYFNDYFANLR